jgi:hypothetical protein
MNSGQRELGRATGWRSKTWSVTFLSSQPFFVLDNPENDPFGVEIYYSLFPWEVSARYSIAYLDRTKRGSTWSCFDASTFPFKTERNGSRSNHLTFHQKSIFP